MDRIGIAGLTLHETDVVGLERARSMLQEDPASFMRDLADTLAASELVVLATCNRVEIAYAREVGHLPAPRDLSLIAHELDLPEDDALRTHLWFRAGRNAVHHILRVASSLDSLVLGEDQILSQVRQAFAQSRDVGLAGSLLGPVYEAAIQVGKEVRTETDLSHHPVSVVSLGLHHVVDHFQGAGASPRTALIGAGRMGALVSRSACDVGLPITLVVNRSRDRAERLARSLGARALDLDTFRTGDFEVDAVVSVTSAPGPVLDAPTLRRLAERTPSGKPLLAVDLAVPRDLEPVAEPCVEVVDLDGLRARAEENRALRHAAAERAEQMVEHKLDTLRKRASDRKVAAVVADVVDETSSLLEHELVELMRGRLAHLGEDERRTVERWARKTFGRMAHVPIRAFKQLAVDLRGNGASEEEEE